MYVWIMVYREVVASRARIEKKKPSLLMVKAETTTTAAVRLAGFFEHISDRKGACAEKRESRRRRLIAVI